jgi:hypothetical protein
MIFSSLDFFVFFTLFLLLYRAHLDRGGAAIFTRLLAPLLRRELAR